MLARNLARWVALLVCVALALLYLNSAAYSAWLSGGPPTAIPQAWAHRALAHLCYSVAALLVGLALFRGIRSMPRIDRLSFVLLVVRPRAGINGFAGMGFVGRRSGV